MPAARRSRFLAAGPGWAVPLGAMPAMFAFRSGALGSCHARFPVTTWSGRVVWSGAEASSGMGDAAGWRAWGDDGQCRPPGDLMSGPPGIPEGVRAAISVPDLV